MALGTVDFYAPLGSALHTRLAPVLGSVFYDTYAPQNTLPPYTVFQVVTPLDMYTFNTAQVELDVQITTVSNQIWPTDARAIYRGTVHPNMQDAPLSMTGFQVLRCRRRNRIEYIDKDKFWYVGGEYIVVVQAN